MEKQQDVSRKRTEKVRRYRAGQTPEWIESFREADQQRDEEFLSLGRRKAKGKPTRSRFEIKREDRSCSDNKAEPSDSVVDQEFEIDLSKLEVEESDSDSSSSDDEYSEISAIRAKARALAKESFTSFADNTKGAKAEPLVKVKGLVQMVSSKDESLVQNSSEAAEEEVEEEEEEEESEEDDNQAIQYRRPIKRAVFIPKNSRKTQVEQEQVEAEERKRQRMINAREIQRKEESRLKVIHTLEKEREMEELQRFADSEEEIPSEEDEINSENELELLEQWKLREILRLKRDFESRVRFDQEQAELERRSQLSEAELEAENSCAQTHSAGGHRMRFLQKYYHKGAFYRDGDIVEEEILSRDYSVPTGMDSEVDRSLLPEVMQVRDFGKMGRSKYTHLVDQDTSRLSENPWTQGDRLRRETFDDHHSKNRNKRLKRDD